MPSLSQLFWSLFLLAPVAMAGDMGARRPQRPDRIVIPGGSFLVGSDAGEEDERPATRTTVRTFRIDRTEVTRAAYARCVAAGRCAKASGDLSTDPDRPMTDVSWTEARVYCGFAGGRLPRDLEWEKAARGNDGRTFPWGGAADCKRANWGSFEGEGPCAGINPGHPVAVGSYPLGASPWGVQDLAGNVWEWVENVYQGDPERRSVRGGSCCSYFVEPRAANRNGWAPGHRDSDLGFRCVAR